MAHIWKRVTSRRSKEYDRLPASEKEHFAVTTVSNTSSSCDTVDHGYTCSPETSRFWGQYSPWFAVPSEIDVAPPEGCAVTFANVLSRHGGRDPTASKTATYALLIATIKNTSTAYPNEYAFLKDYKYTLGADDLTEAGRQEMQNSGVHFFRRYSTLVTQHTPFVRASGQARVVESAENWLKGIAQSLGEDSKDVDVTIGEGSTYNNTLSHDICTAFESGPVHTINDKAKQTWVAQFVPSIQRRVNSQLGTNLTTSSIISLMDMCPYETIADASAKVSDFCHLFTNMEWHQYDYYQTLDKWYGYGNGNPLGPTQGVGYVNELLARLTNKPVEDSTTTNRTLDSNPATFPLNRTVYADFSHDNDITGVLAALGLYNTTENLSNSTMQGTNETHGYSAAWTVPFASRMYVEKLQCTDMTEESVRIIVNDRVMPLEFCDGDEYGRCGLSKFVESQSFARSGGFWSECWE
ncbi:acid phosphatase [Dothidotthia symphoricarpi CBS 119687]|uniref:Phytase A n=1 Tax=Dothidotthia symphoricarpi CBS 119687 TaxID=1392245 RepID=A0A6A6A0A6_9PLEO|nr:acid phosphatase [Dothidotthia symphoricarpi CBS 119687]KAF2124685.1 acid phosphatase [Dothidotthia symphoricarpi CBS 119687]